MLSWAEQQEILERLEEYERLSYEREEIEQRLAANRKQLDERISAIYRNERKERPLAQITTTIQVGKLLRHSQTTVADTAVTISERLERLLNKPASYPDIRIKFQQSKAAGNSAYSAAG